MARRPTGWGVLAGRPRNPRLSYELSPPRKLDWLVRACAPEGDRSRSTPRRWDRSFGPGRPHTCRAPYVGIQADPVGFLIQCHRLGDEALPDYEVRYLNERGKTVW